MQRSRSIAISGDRASGLTKWRLGSMKRDRPPPAERDVLQRALAALVAHRAVERVVDEQELDDRLLRRPHALGLGVDDHAVLDRRRARGLELRDALDLDEAHAAGADRRAELGLVAEDRDLDVAVLGAVDEHDVLRRGDLEAVDRERDLALGRARHRYATAPWISASGGASSVVRASLRARAS